MKREKRSHPSDFKAVVALEAIKGKYTVSELAEKYQVHPSLIHLWKKTVMESAPLLMEKNARTAINPAEEAKKTKEKELQRLHQENEWLQSILQRMSSAERKQAIEFDHPEIPLLRQVKILNVNRSSLYYKKKAAGGGQMENRIAT